ncbi:MAG: M24 family metallopeptidase, partial [Candidatus Colwellbacteria bacterium]|nr:M24 family metallopeptidase [Candidatus Colwellbacteria bacterium]
KGELITIDFGASYNGYMSDITRTVAVGRISPKLKEIYEIVRESQERGCKVAKAGVTGKDIDDVCRGYIIENGYGRNFSHSTGHGLGMSAHESPNITALNVKPLLVNSVVTIEPGIYIQGLGGVRIEDALIVTRNGNINLHKAAPKELIQLKD